MALNYSTEFRESLGHEVVEKHRAHGGFVTGWDACWRFLQAEALEAVIGEKDEVIEDLQANNERLRSALSELVDLMEDVRTGDYKPDSFTCQPARVALGRVVSEQPASDER
jgi:hypothetical protein